VPVKRPILRYCILACLFAITVAYEAPYLHDILRDEARSVPFFTIESATDRVDAVTSEAVQAGIHNGDEVIPPLLFHCAAGQWSVTRLDIGGTVVGLLGLAAQEIMKRIFTAADTFVAGAKQHDDMTLVVLRVT
jgi:hypothetical protein